MLFADKLFQAIKKKSSPICLGLDPRLEQIPDFIKEKQIKEHGKTFTAAAESFIEFNKGIIDACKDLVPIVKPQSAFYEVLGHEGIHALEETCSYAKGKGLLVLLDAKRNDIGSTSAAYSKAFLGKVDLFGEEKENIFADSLTINPYLGSDGINPFLEDCKKYNKGIFVLVKTSNPSSGEIQDLKLESRINQPKAGPPWAENHESRTIFEEVASLAELWGSDLISDSGFSSVGVVVGATYPEQAKKLREMLPSAIFLVPGYGAQGGGAADTLPCFKENGTGTIINNSRGIIFAYQKNEKYSPEQYTEAAHAATLAMKQDIEQALNK